MTTTTATTPPPYSLFQRRSTWLATATLVVVLGGGAWALTHQAANAAKPEAPKTPPVQVTTARVKQQEVQVYRSGIGTVASMATVTVKARIDGQLDKVGFVEGQDVKAGQLLAQLDPRTLQAQLAQAQATKAKDQATLANARADLKRYTTLLGQDAATQQQVDTQKALVNQLEASVQTDAAQVQYAEVQLELHAHRVADERPRRRAPGRSRQHRARGRCQRAGRHQPDRPDCRAVHAARGRGAGHQPRACSRARSRSRWWPMTARRHDEMLGTGTLILLNNQIDTTSGTVQLKGSFANPQHTLWPGQYVNVRLVLERRPNALTVPAAAVQRGQNGIYVYVVDADEQGAAAAGARGCRSPTARPSIEQGLAAGERVVVDGQYKLKPGVPSSRGPRAERKRPAGADGKKPASGSSN